MKIISCFFALWLLIFSFPAQSQIIYNMSLEEINGVSFGYSMRSMMLLGTHTDQTFYPTHFAYFNIDGLGDVQSGSSHAEGVFGGIGFFIGFSALDRYGVINSKEDYYDNQYRLTALDNPKNTMVLIGGDMRFIGLLPFSSEHSIMASYIQCTLEAGWLGMKYASETGAFNKYVEAEKEAGGFYFGLTPGIKVLLFELYFNIGGVVNYYSREPEFKAPKDDDREIANEKKKKSLFVVGGGGGFTIDLCKLNNY